jgi:succinate dehydrogenase hydrophobic anchor subunit
MPVTLSRVSSAVPVAHAVLETITAIAAVCVLLAAGTSVLPEKFDVNKYRLWMRRVQELWWVVLFLAFASYARLYVKDLFRK